MKFLLEMISRKDQAQIGLAVRDSAGDQAGQGIEPVASEHADTGPVQRAPEDTASAKAGDDVETAPVISLFDDCFGGDPDAGADTAAPWAEAPADEIPSDAGVEHDAPTDGENDENGASVWDVIDDLKDDPSDSDDSIPPVDMTGPDHPGPVADDPETQVRPNRRAGRVKTRLLGFQSPDDASGSDVFSRSDKPAGTPDAAYPVGWIVVIDGPGRGNSFTLHTGVSQIGRGEDQTIRLDFGDTSISRENHAALAYDDELKRFFLGHGGKSNLVRLNGKPVLSTEDLSNADLIRIGETTLRFVAFCSPEFSWNRDGAGETGQTAGV